MGFQIRPLLFAAPLLLAAPVHAQQAEEPVPGFQLPSTTGTPSRPNASQQGPELDVFRDPVTPRTTPPVVAPTVTLPPVTVQPTPQPSRPAPTPPAAEPRASRPAERPTPAPAQTRPATPAPTTPPATASTPENTNPPPPVADNATAPAAPLAEQPSTQPANVAADTQPAATVTPAVEEEGLSLPWIVGGVVALLLLVATILLRRRQPIKPSVEPAVRTAATPTPAATPKPATPPGPELVAARPAPVTTDSDRPWLDMDMGVTQARYSMIGVTIAYTLILRNRGDRPAEDVLVRGMLGNGGAQQQAMLQDFFTGADGMPLHSAVSIAPGETIQLAGELRLSPDRIVPVEMGQRSLLIPLAAFDAGYRWGAEDAGAAGADIGGQGRTARAFIVGQEQEPPAERLAPLRLDQGPRQYRRPAARAAAELTPA